MNSYDALINGYYKDLDPAVVLLDMMSTPGDKWENAFFMSVSQAIFDAIETLRNVGVHSLHEAMVAWDKQYGGAWPYGSDPHKPRWMITGHTAITLMDSVKGTIARAYSPGDNMLALYLSCAKVISAACPNDDERAERERFFDIIEANRQFLGLP